MTLRYVATRYRVPQIDLTEGLGIGSDIDANSTLKSLADRSGIPPIEYVQRVQRVLAGMPPSRGPSESGEKSTWLRQLGEVLLSALLVHQYPVLFAALLLGAVGLPVPTGLSVVVAGSLVSLGHMSWLWACTIAIAASVLGDLLGYTLGVVLGQRFLDRRGSWLGYTPGRQMSMRALFDQWGASTIIITRTLASHLSSVMSLLAGLARYPLSVFLIFDVIGRVLWTSAYFALGYSIGGNIEAATDFLTNLSILLVCVALVIGSVLVSARDVRQ
jgi:membrane-associated protein